MKTRHPLPIPARRRSAGLTLIELLVSMAIGLLLMIAVVSSYVGASTSSRMAEAQSRMNEDGQAALTILTQQLKMTGNNPRRAGFANATPRMPVFPPGSLTLRGCDTTFNNITSGSTAINLLTCPASGGGTEPDSIVVRYEADAFNTVSNGGAATDCLGQSLPESGPYTVTAWNPLTATTTSVVRTTTIAENRFYVASPGAGRNPALYCKGNGGANAQPLVDNVEDLQFTYGVAPPTATSTLVVAGYLSQTDISGTASLTALTGGGWSQVATIRVCVVVRSEIPVAPDAESARYLNCEAELTDAPAGDLRLRRAYRTTVVLRNRLQQ